MSLLMRLLTRRGRQAEGLSTPTMRTSASLLVRRPRRKGSKGRRPKHPDDEKTHELAHEVFEEEGVRGRQAEYPEHEVVAVIDGNHFVLEPLYVVGHEVAAMEYWDDGGRAARMGALNQPPDTGKPRSDMDLNI